MSPEPLVKVTLLGRFAVTVQGRAIADRAWGSRKAQHLVKLLALDPQLRLTTEQVLDALWPDQDPDGLAPAFRQACYLARRALGHPDLLVVRGGVVALAPIEAAAIDVRDFEGAAATALRRRTADEYAAALARYGGALLPDDRYADWVILPAERLRALATRLRAELAGLHEQAGADDEAEALWRQIVADDPADEAANVGLMRLYARQGQRQRAVQQYHQLHGRLRDDLAVAPDPATRQLYAAILGGQYPPPVAVARAAPVALPPHALPAPLTTLIGRTAEIAAVGTLLGGPARLVTLTGAGGSGKSRLALAVAEALLPAYADGAWWVELAPLADATLVAETVAQVLGVRPAPGQATREALIAAVRGRTLLLVLDNAEHLRAACADLALELLATCPGARVLATSRAALRAVGEQIWPVPSLPVPAAPGDAPPDLAALAENDAVRLFLARARQVRADFALTPANAAAVAAICRQLEGLPLALELAAARSAILAPAQLAARLGDALGLLTGDLRGVPDRQQTLRATLDWSYDLLDPAARGLLARLAVFAGGWTLDAAEAIGDGGFAVLTGLAGLVEHSLVQVVAEEGAEEPRYRLLEPTRQYALEKLAASGREADARDAHARYFLALAEEAATGLEGQSRVLWAGRLRGEIGNLREALAWWQGRGRVAPALQLAAALRPFWRQQEYIREGWGWLSALVARGDGDLPAQVEARAHLALAELAGTLGHWAEGSAHAERSRRGFAAAGDTLGQAHALSHQAMNLRYHGRTAEARAALERAIVLFEEARAERWLLTSRLHLGVLAFDDGDMAEARAQIMAVLPALRAQGDTRLVAVSLLNLATYTLTMRQREGVAALLAEAIELALAIDEQGVVACALAELADLAALDERPLLAARLLGASRAVHERANLPIILSERPFHERAEAAARAALGDGPFAAALADGAALAPASAAREIHPASAAPPGG